VKSEDVHTLTAAYALDALDQIERRRYERHLTGCGACRAELRGFREVSGRLATAAAADAVPALRDRVLTAVAGAEQPSAALVAIRRPRRWRTAALGAVAATAVVAAAVGSVVAANTHDRLTASQHQQREIAAVLSAPDCKILHARLTTGGTATVVMSPHMRALVVTAAGVRPAPTGQRYQLWLMRVSGDVRVGTLPPSGGGPVMVFAGGEPAGQRLGISLEHDPRPNRPNTPMLAIINL
jgi:anti-sigma factor RsiW